MLEFFPSYFKVLVWKIALVLENPELNIIESP